MKIAITGPTGNVGKKLVAMLQEKEGVELVLLARDANKLKKAQQLGAVVIEGDLDDGTYLRRATQGVDVLFLLIPSNPSAKNIRAFYNHLTEHAACAANSNKVSRIVLLSALGAHLAEKTGPVLGLRDAEWTLKQSDVDLFCLRPTYFMENYVASLGSIQAANAIFLPVSGTARTSMVATKDVAQVAASLLCDVSWTGRHVLELQGAADISFAEAAETLSQASGRKIRHVQVTPEQAIDAMQGMGMGKDYSHRLVELYRGIESGWIKAEQPRSPKTTTATDFSAFVRQIMVPLLNN